MTTIKVGNSGMLIKIPKPILKWLGGKTQILDTIMSEFPVHMNNYHEIFLGGGSVLLALLSYRNAGIIQIDGEIRAYDLNKPLIYMYKNIQSNPVELYETIRQIIEEFNSYNTTPIPTVVNRNPTDITHVTTKEGYYYWTRFKYNTLSSNNKKTILGSALFIFLNKTCFRGVFRVGPRGFNVPYGHYKNPEIINEHHLQIIHTLVQNVIFKCRDFKISLPQTTSGDFIYLDPPYVPENDKSFVKYTKQGFDLETHTVLFNMIHTIDKKIMMSNSDVSLIRDNFDDRYVVRTISCKRSINSKNPSSKTNEVIIMNYL